MIDDLVEAVARFAGLTPHQAERAVDGMLRFMASRLPSPLFGELQARLRGSLDRSHDPSPIDSPPSE